MAQTVCPVLSACRRVALITPSDFNLLSNVDVHVWPPERPAGRQAPDADKKKPNLNQIFEKRPFWRSYGFLDVTDGFYAKNDPQTTDFQVSTTFGSRQKAKFSFFFLDFCGLLS